MQQRWFCDTCDKEWLYALGWQSEAGCPLFGHATIRRITYTPPFPGGDIPRTVVLQPTPAPPSVYEERNGALWSQHGIVELG